MLKLKTKSSNPLTLSYCPYMLGNCPLVISIISDQLSVTVQLEEILVKYNISGYISQIPGASVNGMGWFGGISVKFLGPFSVLWAGLRVYQSNSLDPSLLWAGLRVYQSNPWDPYQWYWLVRGYITGPLLSVMGWLHGISVKFLEFRHDAVRQQIP